MIEAQPRGPMFRDALSARAWLDERLDRLEEAVREAADVLRTRGEMSTVALGHLEAEPLAFRRTASIHLRDLEGAITELAWRRAEREGLRLEALERHLMAAMGHDPEHGRRVLGGLLAGLSERVRVLSTSGQGALDEGRAALDEGLGALDEGMHQVVQRWEQQGAGVLGRWQRRRRLAKHGLEHTAGLPELGLALTGAARGLRPRFMEAWTRVADGAVDVGIARAHGVILDALVDGVRALDGGARRLAHAAERSRGRLSALVPAEGDVDRVELLDERLLEAVADRVGLDASNYLGREGLALADLGRTDLTSTLRAWIEERVADLDAPELADALTGFRDPEEATGPVLDLLTRAQPLWPFHDGLQPRFEGGSLARYDVLIEASDTSVLRQVGDACVQLGLPSPQHEQVDVEGGLSLRILEMASGLAVFAAAERLDPMVQVHEATLAACDEDPSAPRAALRDDVGSEELPDLLPERVGESLRERERIQGRARIQKRSQTTDEPADEAAEPAPVPIEEGRRKRKRKAATKGSGRSSGKNPKGRKKGRRVA